MRLLLTVRRELVPLKHSDTQDVLFQVLYKKLTIGIPLGIQGVLNKQRRKRKAAQLMIGHSTFVFLPPPSRSCDRKW